MGSKAADSYSPDQPRSRGSEVPKNLSTNVFTSRQPKARQLQRLFQAAKPNYSQVARFYGYM